MKKRSCLQTVRLSLPEKNLVEEYLKQNSVFTGFSSLSRVATLSFINAPGSVRLNTVDARTARPRPRFLWDYDLSEVEVREILNYPGLPEIKRWLIGRILTQARFDEVISYLSLEQIRRALGQIRLPRKIYQRWEYAVKRWTKNE